MPRAKFVINKPKILTLTPKWTAWHGRTGGMIAGGRHCCLAEAMLQAGFPEKLVAGGSVTVPNQVPGFTKLGKGWHAENAAMHDEVFTAVNDTASIEVSVLAKWGVQTDGLEQVSGIINCTRPEQKIAVLRRCVHLLGYEGLEAVPPKGYKRVKNFDYSGSTA